MMCAEHYLLHCSLSSVGGMDGKSKYTPRSPNNSRWQLCWPRPNLQCTCRWGLWSPTFWHLPAIILQHVPSVDSALCITPRQSMYMTTLCFLPSDFIFNEDLRSELMIMLTLFHLTPSSLPFLINLLPHYLVVAWMQELSKFLLWVVASCLAFYAVRGQLLTRLAECSAHQACVSSL